MLVAAAYIDLGRHARALEGLAKWSTIAVRRSEYGNFTRELTNEGKVLRRVIEAATEHPDAFAGAVDVSKGVELLDRASSRVRQVLELASDDNAPKLGDGLRDISKAQEHLLAAHDDAIEGHRLLGGTRAVDQSVFERGAGLDLLPAPDIAPADHPVVQARGHKSVQWVMHRILDQGAAASLGIKSTGAKNVPKSGGVLILPNHGTDLDALIHIRAVRRPVRFIGNAKLWGKDPANPGLLGKLISKAGAFPVVQGNAAEGLRTERGILATGQAQVHYAEGMLVHGDFVGSHADGAAEVALQMDVPVVPVGTWGDNKMRKFHDGGSGRSLIDVVYGKKISFEGAEATRENVGIAREMIARAQDDLVQQARQLNERRRQLDKVLLPLAGAGAITVGGAGYLAISR